MLNLFVFHCTYHCAVVVHTCIYNAHIRLICVIHRFHANELMMCMVVIFHSGSLIGWGGRQRTTGRNWQLKLRITVLTSIGLDAAAVETSAVISTTLIRFLSVQGQWCYFVKLTSGCPSFSYEKLVCDKLVQEACIHIVYATVQVSRMRNVADDGRWRFSRSCNWLFYLH